MNRAFKTVWSAVRQTYVVTNEVQKSHVKTGKMAAVVTVAVAALFSGAASAVAYVEPGKVGCISSWETPEYFKDHGMDLINASTAYAEGYTGKGVILGINDSGILLTHPELAGDRIRAVTTKGVYSKDGTRYPFAYMGQTGEAKNRFGGYKKGEKFAVPGHFVLGHSDSHGTHVTGVAAGNRNGQESHGVAWEARVVASSTGGNDNMNYGPFQDYGYFLAAWEAVAKSGTKVINNSWGTNVRIVDKNHHFDVGQIGTEGEEIADNKARVDYDTTNSVSEYFLFKEDAKANGGKNFMDAAWEVAKKYDLIQIFTNGNRRFQNPYYRAVYPFYNPEAENNWIAAGSVQRNPEDGSYVIYGDVNTKDDTNYGTGGHNHAGIAKWWGITSPTDAWNAAVNNKTGEAFLKVAGGTSNAAPHIAGSFAILQQRFGDYMTPTQVRNVLFTTANRTDNGIGKAIRGSDGDKLDPYVPDEDYGWGIIDLGKAIYGPGQFFGTFDVTMKRDDAWHNAIGDLAIQARGKEDAKYLKKNQKRVAQLQAKDKLTDHEAWELEYKEKRFAAIAARAEQGNVGKLVKRGTGTLMLTAVNTYTGGTSVMGGTLAGLTESFGSGAVVVQKGATLCLHKSFEVTKAGQTGPVKMQAQGTDKHRDDATIILESGATLALEAPDISVKNLTVNGKATLSIKGLNKATVKLVAKDGVVTYRVKVDDKLTGAQHLSATYDKTIFKGAQIAVDDDTLVVTLQLK